MALSRKHFTALAEIIGGVEAGRIGPDDLRAVVIEHVLEDEPTFKADKFNTHADRQRDEIERGWARDLKPDEGFVILGQRFIAHDIEHLAVEGVGDVIKVRSHIFDDRVDADDNFVTLYLDPADRI